MESLIEAVKLNIKDDKEVFKQSGVVRRGGACDMAKALRLAVDG